jgi:hypothetical protein
MFDINTVEQTAEHLLEFAKEASEEDLSLAICKAYNRFAQSTACVPITHPSISMLKPRHIYGKTNFHIWMVGDGLIVRSQKLAEEVFSQEKVVVRFGFYPQNPGNKLAMRYAARLNVFLFEASEGTRFWGADLLLVWLFAVQRGLLNPVMWFHLNQEPGTVPQIIRIAQIKVLPKIAKIHWDFVEPVRDALRTKILPNFKHPGIEILSTFPHLEFQD